MNYISFYDIYIILPELYCCCCCFILLLYGIFVGNNEKFSYPILTHTFGLLTFQFFVFSLFLCIMCPTIIMFSWNYLLISNFCTLKLKILVLLISLNWIILAIFYLQKEYSNLFEYWILIILSIIAILFILQVCDFLSMYLAIEFQSLTFYILTSFKRTSEFSTEAGLKYFILGAFSSSLLLFGSSLLYSLTGLSNFTDFSKFITGFYNSDFLITIGILTSLLFLLIALLFKIGVAPFHMWSPDVYEGAPTATTAFLVILPKISLLILFIRLFIISFQDYFFITEKIILISALISLITGAFGALTQKKWKRFIAYSSINHLGFILLALTTGNKSSLFSVLFYLIIYLVTMINLFTWIISYRSYTYFGNYQVRYLNNIKTLCILNPTLTLTLTLVLFSMAGIPPFGGFFAKMFVLLNILKNKIYGTAIISILLSCLTCFYYIRLIKTMYFSPSKRLSILYPINKSTSLILAISFYFLCLIFLDLETITLFIQNIVINS